MIAKLGLRKLPSSRQLRRSEDSEHVCGAADPERPWPENEGNSAEGHALVSRHTERLTDGPQNKRRTWSCLAGGGGHMKEARRRTRDSHFERVEAGCPRH